MHPQFALADGFNHIETRHIWKTDVSNGQAKLASERLLDSVASRDSDGHTITVVLEDHPECIGDASLILDDEHLLLAAFGHDFRLAIVMPTTLLTGLQDGTGFTCSS